MGADERLGSLRPSRRSVLRIAGAGTAATALTGVLPGVSTANRSRGRRWLEAAAESPWTDYVGAVQSAPPWGTISRTDTAAVRDDDDNYDRGRIGEILNTHSLLVGAGRGLASARDNAQVAAFMDAVEDTGGASWREEIFQHASDLIEAHVTKPNKVTWHMGNEINSRHYTEAMKMWAGENYPHPNTPYDDGDNVGRNNRGYIGYFVEYFLAPGVEGIRAANLDVPMQDRIQIVLGSLANGRNPDARDVWLPELLNYVIDGDFAPTLAGARVADLVDYISIHYLLTADALGDNPPWHAALDELHGTWVSNGLIKGIWHTEEGGRGVVSRRASVALRVFSRMTDWALTNDDASPDQIRVYGYVAGDPDEQHSWAFAMTVLHQFLGHDARLISRSAGVTAEADNNVEAFGFETDDGARRVLVITPELQNADRQGSTVVTSVNMSGDGWQISPELISAQAHLFISAEHGSYETFEVVIERDAGNDLYVITLPDPIDLNDPVGGQTLMVELTNPTELRALGPIGE